MPQLNQYDELNNHLDFVAQLIQNIFIVYLIKKHIHAHYSVRAMTTKKRDGFVNCNDR